MEWGMLSLEILDRFEQVLVTDDAAEGGQVVWVKQMLPYEGFLEEVALKFQGLVLSIHHLTFVLRVWISDRLSASFLSLLESLLPFEFRNVTRPLVPALFRRSLCVSKVELLLLRLAV